MDKISIIVPCYNEEESLPYFYDEINKVIKKMKGVDFEILFINDGSKDRTLNILREYNEKNKKIRYISFSRNFGKEAAMYAGLEASTGDFVAIIDADLQDPPSLLVNMYKYIKSDGYDCVATRRVTRAGEPPIRSFFARLFYIIINKISKAEIVDGARDFRLMNRQMTDSILSMKEYNRFSKGIFGWVGFTTKWLEYENIERVAGTTKWSFWKLFLYSIEGIIAFSTVPLIISIIIGLLLVAISIIASIPIFLNLLIFSSIKNYNEVIVNTINFVGGMQMIFIGILGQYIAKIYLEIKKRPVYIIKETEKSKRNIS